MKEYQRRIVGVVADVNDESVLPLPAWVIYHPLRQIPFGGRLFVQAAGGDPYALVPAITRAIHEISAEQPVERAATLADVRAGMLAPDRVNAFVVAGFAGVALAIALVGVAGVLAFLVSARTREFGVRLAIGSTPRELLTAVLREGAGIVAVGIGAGVALGYGGAALAASYIQGVQLPGLLPVLGAGALLGVAAVVAGKRLTLTKSLMRVCVNKKKLKTLRISKSPTTSRLIVGQAEPAKARCTASCNRPQKLAGRIFA